MQQAKTDESRLCLGWECVCMKRYLRGDAGGEAEERLTAGAAGGG